MIAHQETKSVSKRCTVAEHWLLVSSRQLETFTNLYNDIHVVSTFAMDMVLGHRVLRGRSIVFAVVSDVNKDSTLNANYYVLENTY